MLKKDVSQFVPGTEYKDFLSDIKQRYQSAQVTAAHAVNRQMIQFYWQLGTQITEKQARTKWGSKFLEQLSLDLRSDFPGTKGFSTSNLERMRKFATLYPEEIPAQAVRELPWGHIVLLIERVKDPDAREWYF